MKTKNAVTVTRPIGFCRREDRDVEDLGGCSVIVNVTSRSICVSEAEAITTNSVVLLEVVFLKPCPCRSEGLSGQGHEYEGH